MAILKTDGVDGHIAYTRKTARLRATGAITAGDCVIVDTAALAALKTEFGEFILVKASNAADSPLAVGIALQTVAAPAAGATREVLVQTAGQIGTLDDNPPTATGAIGLGLLVGSAAAGDIKPAAAPTGALFPFAVCVTAYTGATTDGAIVIMDKGWYN